MRQDSQAFDDEGVTYCVRHPNTQSNLRCGRCDDLICPRCMVTSPVGARCPSCARIGRPAILDTSANEMSRAILFGLAAAVAGAVAFGLLVRILFALPFAIGLLDFAVAAGGMIGIGYLVGEAVRYGSGKKLDRRLKYVVAGGVFAGWAASVGMLSILNLPETFVTSFGGIAGLVVAFYVGTSRVRI